MSYGELVGRWGGLTPLHHAVRQGHVEATLALRRWMCTEAAGLPRLDDSDAAWGW